MPNITASVVTVLLSSVFRLTWLLPAIIVTIPGGLVISLQLQVSRLREATLTAEPIRLSAATAQGFVV